MWLLNLEKTFLNLYLIRSSSWFLIVRYSRTSAGARNFEVATSCQPPDALPNAEAGGAKMVDIVIVAFQIIVST